MISLTAARERVDSCSEQALTLFTNLCGRVNSWVRKCFRGRGARATKFGARARNFRGGNRELYASDTTSGAGSGAACSRGKVRWKVVPWFSADSNSISPWCSCMMR